MKRISTMGPNRWHGFGNVLAVLLVFLLSAGCGTKNGNNSDSAKDPTNRAASTRTKQLSMPSSLPERLKGLVGEWQGEFRWSGNRSGGGKIQASYYLTGNGSAVLENLKDPESGIIAMTSVYHLDGEQLRMTHYCAAGNQPRLKALSTNPNDTIVNFEILDVTNLARPNSGHVHKVKLEFQDVDHLRIYFTFSVGRGIRRSGGCMSKTS